MTVIVDVSVYYPYAGAMNTAATLSALAGGEKSAFWVHMQPYAEEMRFDAVGVILSEPPKIQLIRGAFEA